MKLRHKKHRKLIQQLQQEIHDLRADVEIYKLTIDMKDDVIIGFDSQIAELSNELDHAKGEVAWLKEELRNQR